jgi:predicted Zn-ribbon and HTH transcriptional regulator
MKPPEFGQPELSNNESEAIHNIGDRKTNIIHTKLRHRCSGLNADLYRVNLKNDPCCACGHLFEDAIHFSLECPLYQHDRTI